MFKKIIKFFVVKKRTRVPVLSNRGEIYDLREIFDRLNVQYFEGVLNLQITWFGNRNSKARTSVRLGSYNLRSQVIKIHRLLDQEHVPDYFVSSVVYHEMLHHVLPPIRGKSRRRQIHHREFVVRERQFQEYALAQDFRDVLKKRWFK